MVDSIQCLMDNSINDSVFTDTLLGLLHHHSPSGHESAAVSWLVDQMLTHGYDKAESDAAGNVVGRIGNGPLHIILLGHIDTVPGKIEVRRDGDLLYGRGAVDAKGCLAAFTAAALKGRDLSALSITVIGAVREESDSAGAAFVREQYQPPDYLIIGEPSRWDQVTLGYKGSAQYDLIAKRSMTHPASQHATASELVVSAWQNLVTWSEGYNSEREKVFNQITATLQTMGSDTDGFVDNARLRVGFRLPPDIDLTDIDEILQKHLGVSSVLARRYPGAVNAYRSPKNTPLVRAALSAIRAEGGNPRFAVKSGTSDMNIVAPDWGCPAIAYGPGDSNLDHTPAEHISLTEYRTSIAVLHRILVQLSNRQRCC